MTTRRLFLRNTALFLAAPAIVRSDSLMKVSAVEPLFVAPTVPFPYVLNIADRWLNPSTNQLQAWNGTAWITYPIIPA